MNKELEALERIYCHLPQIDGNRFKQDKGIIEKSLKALEIIKEKEMLSVFKDIYGKCFIAFNTTAIEISQEEYELLKEIL